MMQAICLCLFVSEFVLSFTIQFMSIALANYQWKNNLSIYSTGQAGGDSLRSFGGSREARGDSHTDGLHYEFLGFPKMQ